MKTEIEQIEAGKQLLEGMIQELYHSCTKIVEAFWKELIAMEKSRPGWENKSCIKLRCVLTGNSIRAEWIGVTWKGKNKDGKFFDVTKFIPKPPGKYRYALTKLFKYSHEWEKPLIEGTEAKLELIRQQASHLTRSNTALRYALDIARKRAELMD